MSRHDHMTPECYLPTILADEDGEGPVFVLRREAATAEDAVVFAIRNGELNSDDVPDQIGIVLMRELDPIACKIRGVEDGYWVQCTKRAKAPVQFWRIDL